MRGAGGQFEHTLTPEILMKLEAKNASLDMLHDMDASEIGAMMRHPAAGRPIKQVRKRDESEA